jgi:hypothetical protein
MKMAGTVDLMDALADVLPRVDPRDEAREVVAVMARITRAASSTLFVERAGALQWLAGDAPSSEAATTIRSAWTSQRQRLLSGTAFTEAPAPARRPMRSWLMWIRRPGNAGLDVVYFAGVNLRPPGTCAAPLSLLAALLVRVAGAGGSIGCDGYGNRIG